MYDEDLARMRAQMLAKQEEEPPIFDDGARFLGQDPNMMQVGLFGRPKKPTAPPAAPPVNLQRRSILGLTPMPADLPAVIPPSAQPKLTPQQMEQAAPQQQPTSSAPSTSPLQSLADKALNAPMTRRDVLQRAGQAALQQVVPIPSITDVIPQAMSPLAAIDTMESLFPSLAARYGMADAFKSGALDAIATSIVEGSAPPYTVFDTYDKLRAFLDGNIPEQDLARMDKLQGSIDWDHDSYFSGDASSKSVKNVEKLYELLDKHKKHIPDYAIKDAYLSGHADKLPFEDLQDFVENNFSGSIKLSPNDLQDYWQTLEPPPPPPMPEKVKAIMKKLGKPKSKGK